MTNEFVAPFQYVEKVKRHFLESELKTADTLIGEYMEYAYTLPDGNSPLQLSQECMDSATRQKLIWLLERLQESVL